MENSAVEWFEREDWILRMKLSDKEISLREFEVYHYDLVKQAKAMEKENIINFALQCMFGRTDIGSNLKNDFIKKYNETFKSE